MDTVARVMGGMAILGLFANAALLFQSQQRLAAIELQQQTLSEQLASRASAAATGRPGSSRRPMRGMEAPAGAMGAKAGGPGRGAKTAGVDLEDEQVREQVAQLMEETEQERREQRRAEWEARHQEATVQEVEAFAQEMGISSETADAVVEELLAGFEQGAAIRQDIHDDKISLFDGRQQMREIREASEARLTEMLGQDNYTALEERLGGGRGGRW